MDSTLSSLRSDLVEAKEEDIDCTASQAYVDISSLNSGLWTRLRSVWLGSTRLEQVSLDYMRYTSMFRSGNAKPTIWALYGTQILFPQGCASSYTDLVIHYDKKTATLALTDSMPYNDIFNEFFREMLVMTAKAKKEGILDRADSAFNNMFRQRAMHEEIARGFIPKPYTYKGF
jgi:hypothetical protein